MEARKRIRVLIADDHPLYRQGIATILRTDPRMELIGEAADGREALESIRAERPDVAVLDLSMPELDGLAVLRAVSSEGLETKVLVVSAVATGDSVYDAFAAGARGYLAKTEGGEAISAAIMRISRDEAVIPPELQAGVTEQIQRRAPTPGPHLTPREREILQLIARGSTTPQIAAELYLSPATVKTHVQHLYEKLGVNDRAAAVMEATRRGLLE